MSKMRKNIIENKRTKQFRKYLLFIKLSRCNLLQNRIQVCKNVILKSLTCSANIMTSSTHLKVMLYFEK